MTPRYSIDFKALWPSVGRRLAARAAALTLSLGVVLSMVCSSGAIALNGASPALATSLELAQAATAQPRASVQPELDLKAAQPQLEAATEAIYKGLERTKRDIGKTELRQEAIEYGRDRAIGKLQGLLERVESADSLEDLSDTDQLTLKRLAQ
ncbi:MAG: hypothetical protein ACFB4J_05295 [Elainellaceae cyanobacterium]